MFKQAPPPPSPNILFTVQLYRGKRYSQTPLIHNTDTEGAIESVCIKLVEFRENVRARDKDSCP